MIIEIKNCHSNDIIISGEANSLKEFIVKAVKNNINLRGVNLRGADLRGVNLQDANLEGSDLRGSDLRGVNFQDANLEGSDLRGTNLRGTYFSNIKNNIFNFDDVLINNSISSALITFDWGELSDELTLELMRHDAECSGNKLMNKWRQGDKCPFSKSVRDFIFREKKELWKPGKPKLRGFKLLKALCDYKGYKLENRDV